MNTSAAIANTLVHKYSAAGLAPPFLILFHGEGMDGGGEPS